MFCPKRQGFFPIIYQRVQDSLSPEEVSEFEKCSTLEERIVFVQKSTRAKSVKGVQGVSSCKRKCVRVFYLRLGY